VQYGLGPIGAAIARLATQRPGFLLVGAVDIDPQKVGQPLAALLEVAPDALPGDATIEPSAGALLARVRPHVVLHSTASSLAAVRPQLEELLAAGCNVISTCEELAYPAAADAAMAQRLDAVAREHHARLLGTGVNPGFVMDTLPVALSAAAQQVRSIAVTRVVDAALRRLPLQRKTGAGLSVEEFKARVQAGAVRHVGLRESAHLLAAAFGWNLDRYEESIEPVVADRPVGSNDLQVAAGRAAGVRQQARGFAQGRQVITYSLEMSLQAANPRDEIEMDSTPPLRLVIPGGIHGDTATAAVVINAIPRLLAAAPGLRIMLDLAVVHSVAVPA
jgi:4-hydroxy-tetrahydrodipicolinate reductase